MNDNERLHKAFDIPQHVLKRDVNIAHGQISVL